MCALSERLFLTPVRETRACEDGAHREKEYCKESHFVSLERLNTHMWMCLNASKHSNLGLK